MKVFLEDGTEIDKDETMLACDNGTVFVFVPDGEKWEVRPSGTTGESSAVKEGVMTDSKGDFNLSFVMQHNYVWKLSQDIIPDKKNVIHCMS